MEIMDRDKRLSFDCWKVVVEVTILEFRGFEYHHLTEKVFIYKIAFWKSKAIFGVFFGKIETFHFVCFHCLTAGCDWFIVNSTDRQWDMDEIKDIIKSIVKGCAQGGVVVSEILAAFVAKTVSHLCSSDLKPNQHDCL